MQTLALLLTAGGSGQIEEIARTFGVDWAHLLAQIISFSIVCIVLQRFAYKRVLSMLATRRQQIAEALANAEKIKAELARTEEQRRGVLDQANVQAAKLIGEGRAAAARVQEQEIQKAIAAAEQIVVKAQEAAAQERTQMLADLKSEFGRLVVQATANVTGKILTPEDQQRLAEETARQLPA
jgi:F-type H+-transporting ATPase subunit b